MKKKFQKINWRERLIHYALLLGVIGIATIAVVFTIVLQYGLPVYFISFFWNMFN